MGLQTTLKALEQAPPELARELWRAALAEPDPDIQRAAAESILRDAQHPFMRVLLAAFPDLPSPVRERVAAGGKNLFAPIRSALQDADPAVRASALHVLEAIRDPEAANLIALALDDPEPANRARGLGALRGLLDAYLASPPSPDGSAQAGALAFALAHVLSQYEEHRQPFFLEALVRLGDKGYGSLVGILFGPNSSARSDLLAVLNRDEGEATAAFLLRLLRERDEPMQQIARTHLKKKRTAAFAQALSRAVARAMGPASPGAAARVSDAPWWPCMADHLGACDAADLAEVLAVVAASKLDPAAKSALFQESLHAPQPSVRRAAIRHLGACGLPAFLPAWEAGASDSDRDVQIEAIKGLVALNPPDKIKLLTPLLNAAHPEARQAAMAEISRDSFGRYLQSFDRLDEKTRALAGQAIAKLDPGMVGRLADEIRALEPDRRLKALKIIEYINKEQELESVLQELLRDPDRMVRATAVKTIGIAGSVEALQVLMRSLADPDRRVRANAVEAFEAMGDPRLGDLLLPFLQDPDNRVRANAVKALWHLGRVEAPQALDRMLQDPDDRMRLSAVWILGEIDWPEAAERLRSALARESNPTVRAKAEELIKRRADAAAGAAN